MRLASDFRKNGLRGLLAAAVLLLVPAAASAFFSFDLLFVEFSTNPAAAPGTGPTNASAGGTTLTLIDLLFNVDPGTGTPGAGGTGGTGGSPNVSVTGFEFSGSSGGVRYDFFFELITIQFGGTPVSGFGAPAATFQRWRS